MLMKKLVTLLILFVGMVSSVMATDYIVSGVAAITKNGHEWWWEDNANKLVETTTSGIYTLVVEGCALTEDTDYGFKVKVNENAWNDGTTFPADPYVINVPYTGTYTLTYFVDIANEKIRVVASPMLRWSLGGDGSGNWDWLYDSGSFFTKTGDFTWTFDVPYATFTSDFSFRIYSGVFQLSAFPNGQDKVLTYGGDVISSAYIQTKEDATWSWKLIKPSYAFEKVRITATYDPFFDAVDGNGQWDVKADAYISKTVNKAQKWATLGCDGAALDLSGLAAKSITAYPLTVSSKGVITKGTPITGVLAANKGVLLETAADENVTLSIPVSAETGTDGSTQLVATTGTRVDKVTVSGYTNYILTEQDGHVGFYKVNDSGNGMLANTAYLHVADTYVPEARAFFWFEDETTGIEAAKASQKMNDEFFNLAGQRVAQPTKGLYIVNGKKVIMK